MTLPVCGVDTDGIDILQIEASFGFCCAKSVKTWLQSMDEKLTFKATGIFAEPMPAIYRRPHWSRSVN